MITTLLNPRQAKTLFASFSNAMVDACVEGTMGSIYSVYTRAMPTSAVAILGDFAFYGGEPNSELARWRPSASTQAPTIVVAGSSGWEQCLADSWGPALTSCTRYAFPSESSTFDHGHLAALAARMPNGCQLHPIDEILYHRCLEAPWSRDFVANYPSFDLFAEGGTGWLALHNGEPVAGASSYASSPNGIEIQVETAATWRRKGLARACSAQLILHCLDCGLYPHWDAANEASAHLARQLGYGDAQAYRAYTLDLESHPKPRDDR